MFLFRLACVVVVLGGAVVPVITAAKQTQYRVPVPAGSKINLDEHVVIHPITEQMSTSVLPEIHGWTQCGGAWPGFVTSYRVQNCSSPNETCIAGADIPHIFELDITPNYSSSQLGMRMTVFNEQGLPSVVLDRRLLNSRVEGGGHSYTVHAIGSASSHFKGQSITLHYILYDVESDRELICVEVDFKIV